MAALLPPGSDALFWAGAGACLAAGGLFVAAAGRGPRTPCLLALFWVLGVLCRVTAGLAPAPAGPWAPAERALDGLLRAIDAADFPHADTAALLKALLAGRRESLDSATVAAFRAAGASHILALSGLPPTSWPCRACTWASSTASCRPRWPGWDAAVRPSPRAASCRSARPPSSC